MAFIYDLADTWNNVGTTFTGIKLNVTDTASAAGSLLMDLQVGGVSLFNVDKSGQVKFNIGNDFTLVNADRISFNYFATGETLRIRGDDGSNNGSGSGIINRSTGIIAWQSTARTDAGTTDLILTRDTANTLAQRNGVNAQAFNLYNTYTDASNYERGALRYDGNVLGLHSQALGTGTVRNIQIGGTASGVNTHLLVGVASRLARFNHSGTTYFEVNTNSGEIRLTLDRTLSQLSATPAVGMIARVTDATAPTIGSTVTGGGAAAALCWYNGTNWTVIGV